MRDTIPSAHVIAGVGSNTERVSVVLRRLGAAVTDAFSYSPGESIQQGILASIRNADFVVVVIDSRSSNVLFEAGLAVGLGKPVAVLVVGDVPIPSDIASLPCLRASLVDDALLSTFLTRFVRSIQQGATREPATSQREHKQLLPRDELDSLANALRTLRLHGSGSELEKLIVDLIGKVATVSTTSSVASPSSDAGVDALVWDDQLSTSVGNPILVEVKRGSMTSERFSEIARRLEFYLDEVDGTLALLVYLDPLGARLDTKVFRNPRIIPFDAEDLVSALRTASFADVVLSARNAIAHGQL